MYAVTFNIDDPVENVSRTYSTYLLEKERKSSSIFLEQKNIKIFSWASKNIFSYKN